jgi:hypothetical protein
MSADTDPFDTDLIVFTPAASRSNRHDGWTPDRQRAFIAALARHGGVAAAARSVGMTPQSARRLRKRAEGQDFARAWDVAVDQGRMRSWFEASRLGQQGWMEPVVRRGRLVGWRHRHSDRLLIAALAHPRCDPPGGKGS